ncbi:hypothetical protein AAL_07508 [Moelleriella libera RCEF 2490]|uniref:Uncharacterized protein n=1 Tax=Moelleriella libera RCEF 2490 TaxID=1081109 RepID=A0A166NH88_9HYPO|nr:hypothetical protein AAL_07508 [Moelleriella libera RCEF 2490]
MSVAADCRRWLRQKQYTFEVTFALNMFRSWEKSIIYSVLFLLISMTLIAAILYLPHHITVLAGRAWYYIKGEPINVAASAREALQQAATKTAAATTTTTSTTASIAVPTMKVVERVLEKEL